MADKKWIQKAVKKPGALRKSLGIKKGKKIPAKTLARAAKAGGKLGQRARLAKTLKGLKKVEELTGVSQEITTRLKYQIQSVDGNKEQKDIDNFVDNEFLALDARAYRKYVSELTPDVDLTFEYTSQKGKKHTIDIPLGIEFFWPAAE